MVVKAYMLKSPPARRVGQAEHLGAMKVNQEDDESSRTMGEEE